MAKVNIFKDQETYLTGQLLVATPVIGHDSIFSKSVIFVASHNHTGSIGVVVNNPINKIQSSIILNALSKDDLMINNNIQVYFGGPVEQNRGFILHTNDYKADPIFELQNNLVLSSNIDILRDIATGTGPSNSLFTIGCAGWASGQLEREISENHWLISPFSEKIIFDNNNSEKWNLAMKNLGVKDYALSMIVGNA
jgi:putative transcriptional regulator